MPTMHAAPSPPPAAPDQSIRAAQEEIVAEFAFFDDWMDRYQYLIDLGRQLPPLPERYRRDEFKLRGCQSQVWLIGGQTGDRLWFQAVSDAAIVSGLIAILLRIYSNRTPREVMETPPDFIARIGLDAHLSPTRRNGLAAMLKAIKARAAAALAEAGQPGPATARPAPP